MCGKAPPFRSATPVFLFGEAAPRRMVLNFPGPERCLDMMNKTGLPSGEGNLSRRVGEAQPRRIRERRDGVTERHSLSAHRSGGAAAIPSAPGCKGNRVTERPQSRSLSHVLHE